jgi:hypothetical protein
LQNTNQSYHRTIDEIRIYRERLVKILDSLRKMAEKRRKSSGLDDPERLRELEEAIDEQQSQIRAFSEEVGKLQRESFEEKDNYTRLQQDKIASIKVNYRSALIDLWISFWKV